MAAGAGSGIGARLNGTKADPSLVLPRLDRAAVAFDQIDADEWNGLVDRSDEGWLYQRREWIRWAREFEHANWAFGLKDERGQLVALMPLYEDRPRAGRFFRVLRLRTGVSGPVTAPDRSPAERSRLRRRLVDITDCLAREIDADLLQVQCAMSAPAYRPGTDSVARLTQVGLSMPVSMDPFRPATTMSRFIDLRRTDDELLADMEQNARSAIRQSLRAGLEMQEAHGREDMARYQALHAVSWKRTGLAPHPLSYFERMWDVCAPLGAIRVLFARSEERDAAAILLHVHKGAAFYWGGCSLKEHQRLRPNNFLLWQAMRHLREGGLQWFELGRFEPVAADDPKSYSVGRFKASFGSTAVVPLEAQRVYRPGKFLAAAVMRAARDAVVSRRPGPRD